MGGGSKSKLPVVNCTVSSAAMAAWKASVVPGATVPLEWEFAPISDVIDDPVIKANVVASINAYIKDQKDAWTKLDKCPPTVANEACSGHGTCTSPATKCVCTPPSPPPNPGCKVSPMKGRMCSGGGLISGTRPVSATWVGAGVTRLISVGCTDSETEFPQSVLTNCTCATDSEGRLLAKYTSKISACPTCTGSWSTGDEKGMSSHATCSPNTCRIFECVFA